MLDTNENGLTELVRGCRSQTGLSLAADFKSYPVNFGDQAFRKTFLKESPSQIVVNFAAHNYIRSEKDIFSMVKRCLYTLVN